MAPTDETRRAARPDELISFAEIRARLGVGKSRAHTITTTRTFPEPWYVDPDGRIRIWLRDEVDAWFAEHRPGG